MSEALGGRVFNEDYVPRFKDHSNVRSELAKSPKEWGRRALQRDPGWRDLSAKLGMH
jgi:hypothetical protein